jgi:hypothetical protein
VIQNEPDIAEAQQQLIHAQQQLNRRAFES